VNKLDNNALELIIENSQRCQRNWDLSKQIKEEDLQTLKTAVTQSDKNLGFMYFLIGLGHVSHECYLTYSWLING
jgi:hypothetical protein